MLTRWYVGLKLRVEEYLRNERGAQALEWIALGMLVLAIMGAIATFFEGDTSLGRTVKNTLANMIERLGEGE